MAKTGRRGEGIFLCYTVKQSNFFVLFILFLQANFRQQYDREKAKFEKDKAVFFLKHPEFEVMKAEIKERNKQLKKLSKPVKVKPQKAENEEKKTRKKSAEPKKKAPRKPADRIPVRPKAPVDFFILRKSTEGLSKVKPVCERFLSVLTSFSVQEEKTAEVDSLRVMWNTLKAKKKIKYIQEAIADEDRFKV